MTGANKPKTPYKSCNEWVRKHIGKNKFKRVDISEFQELKKLQSINKFMSLAIGIGSVALVICGVVIYTTL